MRSGSYNTMRSPSTTPARQTVSWMCLLLCVLISTSTCSSKIEVEQTRKPAKTGTLSMESASASESEVDLAWTEVPKANTYQVIIASDASCSVALTTATVSKPAANLTVNIGGGKAYACIEAFDSKGKAISGAFVKGYEITIPASNIETVQTPVATPVGGTFINNQSITLATVPIASKIYYTTDGSTPTASSTLYTGTITISGTTTIKAMGVLPGSNNSSFMTETYIMTAATPTADISPGAYGPSQTVTLGSATAGALVQFTTDGSTPTCSSASGTVSVTTSMTVKAIACKTNYTDSGVATFAYTINGAVANPTFSVAAGTYTSTQSVTLSTTTPAATIYYTTDGSTPTTASSVYASALSVSTTQTVKALATKATWADSSVASAAYTITGTVATPAFSVAAGSYGSAQSVALSTSTSGATIYYTIDGSTPNTASSVYSSALNVATTQTVKALATKATWADSAVASAVYTISASVTLTYSGTAFYENSANAGGVTGVRYVTISGDTWVAGTYFSGIHYSVTNVPSGLTFVVTRITSTLLKLSFSGAASPHSSDVSRSNLVLTLNAAAFTSGSAASSDNPKSLSMTFYTGITPSGNAFLSSATYDGNLGGLDGADRKCQALAEAASKTGHWKAILSSSTVDAISRVIAPSTVADFSMNTIANDLADLFDGVLDYNFEEDEYSIPRNDGTWTGSDENGIKNGNYCSDWTSTSGTGHRGRPSTDRDWMTMDDQTCTSTFHLHCLGGQ